MECALGTFFCQVNWDLRYIIDFMIKCYSYNKGAYVTVTVFFSLKPPTFRALIGTKYCNQENSIESHSTIMSAFWLGIHNLNQFFTSYKWEMSLGIKRYCRGVQELETLQLSNQCMCLNKKNTWTTSPCKIWESWIICITYLTNSTLQMFL